MLADVQDTSSPAAADAAEFFAENISRAFDGIQALDGVTLRVTPGQVLGLIGPNGAGKSTLVNILSGYDLPDTGRVVMDGSDITQRTVRARTLGGLARTFQHGHIYPALSVTENVQVAAIGTGRSTRQARTDAAYLLGMLGIDSWAEHQAAALPHGVERLLGVARAVATRPRYLLLDEPAAGLNEGEIDGFADAIRHLATVHGMGILLIDHNMKLIRPVCDYLHVLVEGRSFADGLTADVMASEALAEAYLGRSGRER